jgi:hypothetical protein
MKGIAIVGVAAAMLSTSAYAYDLGFGAHMSDKGSRSFSAQQNGYQSFTDRAGDWFSNNFGWGYFENKANQDRQDRQSGRGHGTNGSQRGNPNGPTW